MSASIERLKIGDKRKGTEMLEPGTYDLNKGGEWIRLRVRCRIDTEETFKRFGDRAGWFTTGYLHDTLVVMPTRWQRFKAFVMRMPPPIPRAVLLP